MLERIKEYIYNKIASSQFVYDVWCDIAEDAGMLTSSLEPEFECGYPDRVRDVVLSRRRRRRRSRRRRRR